MHAIDSGPLRGSPTSVGIADNTSNTLGRVLGIKRRCRGPSRFGSTMHRHSKSVKINRISKIFIGFHWFLLISIDFHWISSIFIDFHWFYWYCGRAGGSRGLEGQRQRRLMTKYKSQYAPSVVRDLYGSHGRRGTAYGGATSPRKLVTEKTWLFIWFHTIEKKQVYMVSSPQSEARQLTGVTRCMFFFAWRPSNFGDGFFSAWAFPKFYELRHFFLKSCNFFLKTNFLGW